MASGVQNMDGYKGTITNGKIIGTVPEYIYKYENDKYNLYPITQLNYTFAYLDNLTIAPEIPKTVTTMESTFFYSGINSVVIPSNVKYLKSGSSKAGTFEYCTKLHTVTLAEGIKEIDSESFYDCSILKNIMYSGTKAQWNLITKSSNSFPTNFIIVCKDGTIN